MPASTVRAFRDSNLAGKSLLRDQRCVSYVTGCYERFRIMRNPIEEEWTNALAAYLVKPVRLTYHGHTVNYQPTMFILNERVIPRIIRSTVGRGKFFEARPRTAEEIPKCRATEALIERQLDEDGFRAKYQAFIRETMVLGTGVWKDNWCYEIRKTSYLKRTEKPLGVGEDGPVVEEEAEFEVEERIIKNGPTGDRVDPWCIYADPTVSDPQKTPIIEDQLLTVTQMKVMVRAGLFSKAAVEKVIKGREGLASDDDRESRDRDALLNLDTYHEAFHGEGQKYRYREFWGEFPLEQNEKDPDSAETAKCLIGVIGNVVVQLRRNPYNSGRHPYKFARPITFPGRLYGLCLTHMNLGLYVEECDLHNQAADARKYILNPMLTASPGTRKRGSYTASPGKVLEGENVRPFVYPDITMSATRGMQLVREQNEDAFGAPGILSGESISGEAGATGAAIRQQEANVRIKAMAEEVEETFIKPLLETWHDYNEQFMTTDRRVLVLGPRGFEHRVVRRKDVVGQFDFTPLASTQMESRAILSANYQAITPLFLKMNEINPGSVNLLRWAADILRDVFQKDHPEYYIREDESDKRPITVKESMLALSLGHRLTPDPRSLTTEFLEEYGAEVQAAELAGTDDEILKDFYSFGNELVAAVQQKIALQKQQEVQAAQMQAMAEQQKGGAPAPIGPGQRDGQGMTMPRRLTASMQGGPLGQGRG